MIKANEHKLEEARLIGMETLEALGDHGLFESVNLKGGQDTSSNVKKRCSFL